MVADKWGFVQVTVLDNPEDFNVVIISLPHWVQTAVEEIHDLAKLLSTFRVGNLSLMRHVMHPGSKHEEEDWK